MFSEHLAVARRERRRARLEAVARRRAVVGRTWLPSLPRRRLRRSDPKLLAVASLDAFAGLGYRRQAAIAALVDEVHVPAGDVLRLGRQLAFVVDGAARAVAGHAPVAVVGPGAVLGGDLAPPDETATAVTPLRLLVAGARQVPLVLEEPTVAAAVARSVLARRPSTLAPARSSPPFLTTVSPHRGDAVDGGRRGARRVAAGMRAR